MQVLLIRHAEAVDESLALRDPYRHLSARGRVQAHALGERLRWYDCAPTHVWSSPLVRAVQTAELVVGHFEPEVAASASFEIVPGLAPGGDLGERAIAAMIDKLAPQDVVYLVGHEPQLSAIGAVLLGDPKFATLARAQAVRIFDGKLRWRFAHDGEAPELEFK